MIRNNINDFMNKVEILAPAGDKNALIAAINAGCDAIYLGYSKFSARAGAKNFDSEELRWAVSYAHLLDVKIYLTINTIIKNNEIAELIELVGECMKIGVDAFIIQDIGGLAILKKIHPDIVLHSSTQMNIHSSYGASYVKSLGVERLILARELRFDEISYIKKSSQMEVETFVHGALCYSYSGQCLMSSSLGDRSGNRGSCAQPCRLKYDVSGKEQHVLSLKDLSSINILEKLIEIGVNSIKIEGRVKTSDYVYQVVKMYRKYLDNTLINGKTAVSAKDYEKILQVYNRGEFSSGFYEKHSDKSLIGRDRPRHQGLVIGKVTKIKGKKSYVTLIKKINKGDRLEFIANNRTNTITANEDCKKTFIINGVSKINSELRRLGDVKLTEEIQEKIYVQKMNIDIEVVLKLGEPSKIIISRLGDSVSAYGDIVSEAKSMPISYEKVYDKVNKTMDYPFNICSLVIDMDDNIFMPLSKINELRRKGLEAFFTREKEIKKNDFTLVKPNNSYSNTSKVNVLINNFTQFDIVKKYPVDTIYINVLNLSFADIEYIMTNKGEKKVYAVAPKIVRDLLEKEMQEVKDKIAYFDGILISSVDSFEFLKDLGKAIRLDYGMNIFNNESVRFFEESGTEMFMPSLELSYRELSGMNNKNAEVLLYAHITTMTTASCIKKTSDKCEKNEGAYYTMLDRKKEKIFYETKCTFCYNKIYNSHPLYLIDKKKEFNEIGVSNFRIDFNFEDDRRIKGIMDEVFYGKKYNLEKFTRGHFEKGIK